MTLPLIQRSVMESYSYDPVAFGSPKNGTTNSYAAWKRTLDAAVTNAASNGGIVYLEPSPVTYSTTWNGATGVDVGLDIDPTLMNYRSTFVIDDADVTKVVLDLSGCTIKQGGTTWEDFATWLTVVDADLHVKVDGTTFDFDILLTTQGEVTAIVAPTSGDNGYVEFTIDPLFPVQTPEWLDVNGDGVISEVVTCSSVTYAMARPERHFVKLVLDRDEYTSDHAAISHQSGTTYRISGLTSAETTAFTNNGGVGTYIVVKHCTDTGAWFKTIGAGKVTVEGIGFVRQSLQHFIITHMVGDGGVSVNGIFGVPREGVMTSCMRNFHGGNANYGQYRLSNIAVRGGGDDVLTSNGITLRNMEYVDSTHFDAFAGPHFYGKTIRDGSRVEIYDASSGGYSLVAYGKVEASGSIDPADSYLARYTFTKDAASSALPSDLTDHVAAVLDTYNPVEWDNCRAINVRGRGGWLGIPIGKVIDCEFTLTTDQGLKVDPAGGAVAGTAFPGGDRLLIKDCVLRLNCRDTFFESALAVFASSEADDALASTDKIITSVLIEGCLIANAPHMAMLLGGSDTVVARDNLIVGAATSTPVSGQRGYTMGFTSPTVIGYANCDNLRIGDGMVFKGTGSAAKFTGVTHSGGSNNDVVFELYDDVDLTTHIKRVVSDLMIESATTDPAKLRLKTSATHMSVFVNSTGMFVRNEGNATNLFYVTTAGDILPTSPVSLGTTTNRWSTVATGNLNANGEIVSFGGLPTSDPAVAGRIWNDRGFSKVSGTSGSLAASEIAFTPTGNLAGTNLQAVAAELDTEKAALAGAAFTGDVAVGHSGTPATRLEVTRISGAGSYPSPLAGTVASFTAGNGSASSPNYVRILSGNTALAGLNFGDTDSDNIGRIWYDNASDSLQIYANGGERLRCAATGDLQMGGANTVIDASRHLMPRGYLVDALPTPGTARRMAYATNCRMFNGAGVQEGAGAGTGGVVADNGTAWKIVGTNVTAVA